MRSSPLYQVSPQSLLLGLLAGLAVGVGGGWLLATAAGHPFFLLWGSLLYGGAVAEALLRATGRKRGPVMEALAGLCTAVGAVAGFFLWWSTSGYGSSQVQGIAQFLMHSPFYLAGAGLAVFCAVSRVRYF